MSENELPFCLNSIQPMKKFLKSFLLNNNHFCSQKNRLVIKLLSIHDLKTRQRCFPQKKSEISEEQTFRFRMINLQFYIHSSTTNKTEKKIESTKNKEGLFV